ncbi:P-loop containing nucleoside triphosphate hydrolase protein [Aspergillus navahoensis]
MEFREVSASYENGGDAPTLNGVSLQMPPGAKVVICGRSGSGKSSLLLCLLRLLEVQQVSITIDGCDIAILDPVNLRARIGTVPHAPFFMPGSVRQNVYLRNVCSDCEVIRILQKVSLSGSDPVSKWPHRGTQERGLVNGMDTATETLVQRLLETECQGCTVLAVMHRLHNIEWYDLVALVDGGIVVELDAPAALLGRDSQFAKLYHAQAV